MGESLLVRKAGGGGLEIESLIVNNVVQGDTINSGDFVRYFDEATSTIVRTDNLSTDAPLKPTGCYIGNNRIVILTRTNDGNNYFLRVYKIEENKTITYTGNELNLGFTLTNDNISNMVLMKKNHIGFTIKHSASSNNHQFRVYNVEENSISLVSSSNLGTTQNFNGYIVPKPFSYSTTQIRFVYLSFDTSNNRNTGRVLVFNLSTMVLSAFENFANLGTDAYSTLYKTKGVIENNHYMGTPQVRTFTTVESTTGARFDQYTPGIGGGTGSIMGRQILDIARNGDGVIQGGGRIFVYFEGTNNLNFIAESFITPGSILNTLSSSSFSGNGTPSIVAYAPNLRKINFIASFGTNTRVVRFFNIYNGSFNNFHTTSSNVNAWSQGNLYGQNAPYPLIELPNEDVILLAYPSVSSLTAVYITNNKITKTDNWEQANGIALSTGSNNQTIKVQYFK